jgi:hypothetical protein
MGLSLAQASSMDLSQDYNFTGTVTGMGTAGAMTLIKSITASSSASVSFVNGSNDVVLDSTYKSYKFVFKNIHPGTDNVTLQFQGSTDGGSNYNTTMTTTVFIAKHHEDDSATQLVYRAGQDQAQGTNYQTISEEDGADNDQNTSGELWLYNPSSTTYVKHFMSRISVAHSADRATDVYAAGYFNTTSAINAIRFQMSSSSNIDDGTISLYGIS